MKDKAKAFWKKHGDLVVAGVYSAGLIVATAAVTAPIVMRQYDKGWRIEGAEYARGNEKIYVLIRYANGMRNLVMAEE